VWHRKAWRSKARALSLDFNGRGSFQWAGPLTATLSSSFRRHRQNDGKSIEDPPGWREGAIASLQLSC